MQDATIEASGRARGARLSGLSLAALGVICGDIGTSPLYAFREALRATGRSGEVIAAADVLGVLSLILWALILLVSVKYVLILLRADNHGEGGTLSLLALARQGMGRPAAWVTALGITGAALFMGDAVITPAISVLSAVEGLVILEPGMRSFVVPLALLVLISLFLLQRRGTAGVARWFGPVMLIWFLILSVAGLWQIMQHPPVLMALNPAYALRFLISEGAVSLVVLGATFLAVTGAEALYADMGHFGRRPIVIAWACVAFPALALNYFGQAALVLRDPTAAENPFFSLFPSEALLPVILLAAMATVIASQAVISGAFSITRQAVQLRLLPRLRIRHTSEAQEGQIFIPAMNLLLLLGVMALVISFGSSADLASAYGISVTGAMVVTTLLAMLVARHHWGWPWTAVLALLLPFLMIDLVFLSANLLKILEGGWVPLLIAGVVMGVMLSWQRGVAFMEAWQHRTEVPLDVLLAQMLSPSVRVIPGMAICLTTSHALTPTAVLHCLKHFHALHERLILLTIRTTNTPFVTEQARLELEVLTPRVSRATVFFGYAEVPDVPKALKRHYPGEEGFNMMSTSFILSRRHLRAASQSALPWWQARIFLWCARNSAGPSDYFRIPPGRVVEIGTQVDV